MTHAYENWELFGKFVCRYRELCGDGELSDFVRCWSYGEWDVLDEEWPEWGEFVNQESLKPLATKEGLV